MFIRYETHNRHHLIIPACTLLCKVAATNLVAKVLRKRRKHHAGRLIKTSRMVNALTSEEKADFGECGHSCASSEPYFYDTAYSPVKRDYSIQVDENGKCVVADEIVSTKVQTKPLKPPVTTEASRVGSHGDQSTSPAFYQMEVQE